MIRFENSWYLLLLPVILSLLTHLYIRVLRWKQAGRRKIGDIWLVDRLMVAYSPFRFRLKFLLGLLALLLIVFALANLQFPKAPAKEVRSGADVMFVLDVSKSMYAKDITPSRLDRARLLLIKLNERLGDNRVGLVIFAGRAYLQMPLTSDHLTARMYVSTSGPESVPAQGTVISEGLRISADAFPQTDKKYRAIILVTDGEDHDKPALEEAKKLSRSGISLHVVGVGTEAGTTFTDPASQLQQLDADGRVVVSKLNEGMLEGLAIAASGTYQRLEKTDQVVDRLLQEIGTLDKRPMASMSTATYTHYFQWFVAIALLMVIIEFFLSERKAGAA